MGAATVSGVTVQRTAKGVEIACVVGEKTARLTVTPDYAKRLAAQLVAASLSESSIPTKEDFMSRIEELLKARFGTKP